MSDDSEGLESDDVEITEKMSIEGAKDYLDSEEEIMDELDVDVPTAATITGLGVPEYNEEIAHKFDEGDELVRRKGIVEKLESSIRASLKFRDGFSQGTDSWHRYNHAAQEKLAILRYVVNKPREELEKEDPRKLLEELLEEVSSSE